MNIKQVYTVLEALTLQSTPIVSDTQVSDIVYDSRKVSDGCVFCALCGVKTDGHIYIPSSIEKGASVVVCESKDEYEKYKAQYPSVSFILVSAGRKALAVLSKHYFDCACEKLKIIGITGTKGKTSTSFMIAKIFSESGLRCGIIGTTGAYFEDYFEEMSHSTPESRELHELFSKMYSMGATHVVMEVSSQALMMDRVFGLEFEAGIFTNITPDHIGEGEHKDFEDYLYWKSRLFTVSRLAIVNKDADRSDFILDVCRQNGLDAVTYSCADENCDYFAHSESFYIDSGMKTKFTVDKKVGESFEVMVSVPGKFSVFNALCAISTAMSLGCDCACVTKALTNVKVIGRIEPVDNPRLPCPVIIDYAHNAMSLESLFTAINAYKPGKIICVFGCGGNRSKLRRYEMGEISGKYADLSIITADNSRFEELDDIISDILIGMHKTDGKYEIIKDRKDAIYRAIDLGKKGDIILLAGKGQETYLDIKGVKTHFDEREVVNSYFN